MENTQTTNLLIVIFCAVLPAFLIILYIYWKDKYQREPFAQLAKGFAFGIVSALIAIFLEMGIGWIIGDYPEGWIGAILQGFVGAAIPEEAAKLLMLYLLLRRNPYFDERFDGIVYATCVGMGFAGAENIVYLLGHIDFWQSVAVSRAVTAVPGHFMFAIAMGYFYALLYFDESSLKAALSVYTVPVLLHGTYDSILFAAELKPAYSVILSLLFFYFCFKMLGTGRKRIQNHLSRDRHDPQQRAFYAKGD